MWERNKTYYNVVRGRGGAHQEIGRTPMNEARREQGEMRMMFSSPS